MANSYDHAESHEIYIDNLVFDVSKATFHKISNVYNPCIWIGYKQ